MCGYNTCASALEFHHINDDKEGTVGVFANRGKLKEMINEMGKCIILCCNCHKELHEQK